MCMPMARPASEVERALRSVLAQDFTDFELLIGDETGAARALVTDLADPRVDYRHNPTRLGFSSNHVALLDRARGRYMAVLHDDDRWEPTFLSRLVAVLERHPDIAMACCRVVIDRGAGDDTELWPTPLRPGRNDDLLGLVLAEEWFLLLDAAIWRREVWAGPARQWPDLCCGDLQFFLSAVEARWPLYFLDTALTAYTMHRGQSGAWRGPDSGLAVADDVLAFWDGWLQGRPDRFAALTARQRARWHLRRARALLLAGRTSDARRDVARAEDLGGSELPDLRRLKLAVALPNSLVRGAVALKRGVTDRAGSVGRR
ncbi:MAG TPA: glycosyltransferase family A protein [Acidimicrobiales bacterium]|nr:glycosyltransferase family A protein [Acidimicrobiales bacterium]